MLQPVLFGNVMKHAAGHYNLGNFFWLVQQCSTSTVQTSEPALQDPKGALHNVPGANMGLIVSNFSSSGRVENGCQEEGM